MMPTSLTVPGKLPVLWATSTPAGSKRGKRSLTRWRSSRCTISALATDETILPCANRSRKWSMSDAGATAEHHRSGVVADRDHPLERLGNRERLTDAQLERARVVFARLVGNRQLFTHAQPGFEHREQDRQLVQAGGRQLAIAVEHRAPAATQVFDRHAEVAIDARQHLIESADKAGIGDHPRSRRVPLAQRRDGGRRGTRPSSGRTGA